MSWLGLRSRLVLLVLLALLPVFGLFAYSAAKNQQVALAQAQANLQSEALLAAANITLRLPSRYSGASTQGAAAAGGKIAALQEALSTAKMLDGAQLRVLDRRGMVLAAYPPAAGLAGMPEPDEVVLQAASARQPGAREAIDAGGVWRIYAYAPVAGAANGELFVAISMARELSALGSRGLLQDELAALLALTAFGIACAWAMGKRLIVNPAHEILKEANEIARGNLEARVSRGRRTQDEMGLIGQAFNRMAEALQAQRKELDAALRHAEKERVLLDLILNSMNEGVVAVDTEGGFLRINASARRHYGPALQADTSLEYWRLAHEILLLDGATPYPFTDRPLVQALRGISTDNVEMMLRRPGVDDKVLRMTARPLYDHDRNLIGGLAVFNDITEIKVAEVFAEGQQQVLTLIAGSAPLSQSLDAVMQLIEKSSTGSLCSILLVDAGQLCHGSAPSLGQDFIQAIGAMPIAEGAGPCGTAAFRKQSVIVADVGQDPLANHCRALLLAHGLHACWSTPVLASDGEVLATFAIYRQTPGEPQTRDLELIATATQLASLALARARAEAAVLAGEARFRELAENTEDVFYNFDSRSDHVLYVSPGYEKIWGRSCESLYADPPSYAYPIAPEDIPLLRSSRQHARAGEPTDIEFRLLRADGQIRWIRNRSYPIMNAAGQIERTVGIARDITERKLADLQLAATNRALQMLSRSSIAINRIDEEAILLAEVCRLAVDVGGYRMAWVGYARDDEEKRIEPVAQAGQVADYLDVMRLSWRDDVPGGQGPAGQAIRGGQPRQSSDIGKADNHFFWHEAALERGFRSAVVLPLRSEARIFGVLCLYAGEIQQFAGEEVKLLQELADNLAFGIGSLRAREEIRQLNTTLEERVRQRTSQLEFANQQLEAFSYSVSHDLRSPLSAIDGFSNLLAKSANRPGAPPLSDRSRHYLARIRAGVGQMGELIDALLSLAQVSRSNLRWELVGIGAQAQALLTSLQEREPGRPSRLQVDTKMVARGDARLLRQVLDNLLANAWKFTRGQACTEITVGSEEGSTGEIIYFVRDNGAGFDMAYAEKLFGAFQRLHSQAEFAGTGIGLATVQRIITRHGGRVWAESAPGQGATFYFTLGAERP